MKPYKPSNKAPIAGIVFLMLAPLAGVAIGGLVGLLSMVIYLVLLFPLLMGFATGAVVKAAVREGRVRNPLLAALFGLIAGILMFAAMHAVQYFSFRAEFRDYIVEEYGPLTQSELAQIDQFIDQVLVEETQASGFWGYMRLRAEDGVSIGRVLGSSRFNLGPFLSWVYWLAEVAVAAGIAAVGGWQAAGKPFCEACNQWYGAETHLGGVPEARGSDLLAALKLGGYAQAGSLLQEDSELPSLELHLQDCEACQVSDSRLSVTSYQLNNRGKVTSRRVVQGMIIPAHKDELVRAIEKTPNPDPEEDRGGDIGAQ